MSYKVLTKKPVKRHLIKTISYSIITICIGLFSMWYITGNIIIGISFGFAEIILKPIIYYFHEKIWYNWFKFGLIEEKIHKVKKVQLNEVETKVITEIQLETFTKKPTNLVQPTGKKVLNYSSNR
jgi:uncharacterized membrane protein